MSFQSYEARHLLAGDRIQIMHAMEFRDHVGVLTKDAEPVEVRESTYDGSGNRTLQLADLFFTCDGRNSAGCKAQHHYRIGARDLVNAERVHR